MTEPCGGQHRIRQELLYLSVGDDGGVWVRVESVPLPTGAAPDVHARAVLGWHGHGSDGRLLHSTSWRYDTGSSELVLTWAVIPDPAVTGRWPVRADISTGATGTHPVPDGLTIANVAAHAARHMAFLLHHDRTVGVVLHEHHRALHDALLPWSPDVAGEHTGHP